MGYKQSGGSKAAAADRVLQLIDSLAAKEKRAEKHAAHLAERHAANGTVPRGAQ